MLPTLDFPMVWQNKIQIIYMMNNIMTQKRFLCVFVCLVFLGGGGGGLDSSHQLILTIAIYTSAGEKSNQGHNLNKETTNYTPNKY